MREAAFQLLASHNLQWFGFQREKTAVLVFADGMECLTCFPRPGPLQQLLHGEQVLGLHRLQQFLVLPHLPL